MTCAIRSCRHPQDLLVYTTRGDQLGFCDRHGGRLMESGLELPATRKEILSAAWKCVRGQPPPDEHPEPKRAPRPVKRSGPLVRIPGDGIKVRARWGYKRKAKK